MVRHTDADGLLLGEHDARHQFCSRQDERIRAGQAFPHQPVGRVADMTVLTDIFQVRAHEAERLVLRPFFNLVNALDGFLVEYIAADTVHGIGGITDHPSFSQHLYHLGNKTCLGVIRIDFQKHCHDISPEYQMEQLTRKRTENPPEFSDPAGGGQTRGLPRPVVFTVFFYSLTCYIAPQ